MPPKRDQPCSLLHEKSARTLPRKAEFMKGLPFVLAFTAMTFIAWGAYGPLLHHGTLSMGNDSLRAFVGVGIAYFFIAVLVPIYILRSQGEAGKWTMSGTFYSLFAGSVGALGALGVILALAYGGSPIYVMPLVFGFAPIVNTLVTAWMSKTFDQISPVFIGGIVVAALGVAGVLAFKPAAPPHAAHPTKDSKEEHKEEHDDKKSTTRDHAILDRRDSVRLVSSLLIQEPQDPLPPVVVQPPAPEPAAPAAPTVPQVEATQPKPAEQPAAAPDAPQELPPIVVQPVAPEPTTPAPTTTPATTTEPAKTPAAQEPTAELPPVVVQPVPLKQADATTSPKVEAPKVEAPKVEAPKVEAPKVEAPKVEAPKTEPAKPEITKPESVKPDAPKPEPAKPEPTKPEPKKELVAESAKLVDEQIEDEPKEKADKPAEVKKAATTPDVPMIILSIFVAAICWGSYGPMLHQGQARMGGSRLRPFTCVGLAYFFIAVAAPLAVISARAADTGSWSVGGLSWSIVAGAAGAIGALGVILAFNAGGKPYYVMPLVFGFAPVINTCISLTEKGTWGLATPMFWISLGVVIAGAITVLLNAPKPKPHAKPAT